MKVVKSINDYKRTTGCACLTVVGHLTLGWIASVPLGLTTGVMYLRDRRVVKHKKTKVIMAAAEAEYQRHADPYTKKVNETLQWNLDLAAANAKRKREFDEAVETFTRALFPKRAK